MLLAKPHLDVGFSVNDWPAAEGFWRDTVGLPYEEFLKIGSGVRQHRFGLHGSVVKVNHARDPLPASPTVLTRLRIASGAVTVPTTLHEPAGTAIEIVPHGFEEITGIEVVTAVSDAAATRRFWIDGIGATEVADGRYLVGDTLVRCVPTPGLSPMTSRNGQGFRYLTVQVHDVDAEHARITSLGFREDLAPTTLGQTARISFVRDPDGLYLEVSQRASLTGPITKAG